MNTNGKKVVTRFPPSPTGFLHVGSARTALFNYLFTAQHGGVMHLRIEDTDRQRSTKEYEDNIIEGLAWLTIPYADMVRQSERGAIYAQYTNKLLETGAAYWSDEEEGKGKIIRFKNPGGEISFTDLIRGKISFDVSELGDFAIARDEEHPLYHLAVVIDDHDQGVTHIIRGEDGISNTPRQILIQRAIGADEPVYAHIPLILAPDRSKLSKRFGAVSVTEYREQGYLPEALINFLALLGWSPQSGGDDRELFSLSELVERFDLSQVHKSGAVFDIEKLKWMNREYLRLLPVNAYEHEISERLPHRDASILKRILPILSERIYTFADITQLDREGELDYFFEKPKPTLEQLKTTQYLEDVEAILAELSSDEWTAEHIKNALWDFATEKGRGEVLWPLRVALSGKNKSPDPFTLAALLGKEETLIRIKHASTLA